MRAPPGGAFMDDKMVSVAGTHVLSTKGRTALVANIVTDSDWREFHPVDSRACWAQEPDHVITA